MANVASRGKVLSNHHLFLFPYSRFNSTILRNLFACKSVNNSFRKWEKSLLCYVVNWNLASTQHILLTMPPRVLPCVLSRKSESQIRFRESQKSAIWLSSKTTLQTVRRPDRDKPKQLKDFMPSEAYELYLVSWYLIAELYLILFYTYR